MSALAGLVLGFVFIALPIAVIYVALLRGYDGPRDATGFRAFRGCYAIGAVVLVATTVAVPLAVRGAVGTGPAVFAPLLRIVGPAIAFGLACFVVALGAYGVTV